MSEDGAIVTKAEAGAEVEGPGSSGGRRHPAPRLSGAQKVAVVLAQLGAERSARILGALSDAEAIELTMEIANLPPLALETVQAIVEEFLDRARAAKAVSQGGVETARAILEQRLGAKRAEEVLGQISNKLAVGPLAFLVNMDPEQVVGFLVDEHPQTIAVLVAHMPPEDAARVLGGLPESLGIDVAQRIAKMDRVSPEAVSQAASLLEGKLRSLSRSATAATGGIRSLVEILNRADRSTERRVLEGLERSDGGLAEEVRTQMFTFEDVLRLDDRALQAAVRGLDTATLALALKASPAEDLERFTSNMTDKAAAELREELEVMGPVPASAVDEAQSAVVRLVRELAEEGTIRIMRDGEIVG